jgi:hypothetical protein
MSTEHIGGLQGIKTWRSAGTMIGLAAEAKPRRTAVGKQDIDSLPAHPHHCVDIYLSKKLLAARSRRSIADASE